MPTFPCLPIVAQVLPLNVGYLQQPSAEMDNKASRIFVCTTSLLKTDQGRELINEVRGLQRKYDAAC